MDLCLLECLSSAFVLAILLLPAGFKKIFGRKKKNPGQRHGFISV